MFSEEMVVLEGALLAATDQMSVECRRLPEEM